MRAACGLNYNMWCQIMRPQLCEFQRILECSYLLRSHIQGTREAAKMHYVHAELICVFTQDTRVQINILGENLFLLACIHVNIDEMD